MSVSPSDVLSLKVKTDALDYRVDIYRMGYYGGMGARRVDRLGCGTPHGCISWMPQPACLTESDTGLVDCGNWHTSVRWAVPSDATSGLYFARLVITKPNERGNESSALGGVGGGGGAWRIDRSPIPASPLFARAGVDSTRTTPPGNADTHAYGAAGHGRALGLKRHALKEPRASHVYFVVRDDAHTSDILVQTKVTCVCSFRHFFSPSVHLLFPPFLPAPLNICLARVPFVHNTIQYNTIQCKLLY